MKKVVIVGICIFVFGILALIVTVIDVDRHQQIENWAHQNGYTVKSVDRVWFPMLENGGFWPQKNDDEHRSILVDTSGHERVAYFRWWPFFQFCHKWRDE